MLWFAFNSVYLNYQKQRAAITDKEELSCDLLSIQYIWTTRNNRGTHIQMERTVVICFQFSIFELPETTNCIMTFLSLVLWFAFNSVYLNYQKQLRMFSYNVELGCDLLSIQYIWTTRNNHIVLPLFNRSVVICFQFSIFELPETTVWLIYRV